MPVDTSKIYEWRSIVTLIVFVLTNLAVLFPFDIPIYLPRSVSNAFQDTLSWLRIIPPRKDRLTFGDDDNNGKRKSFVRVHVPINFVTAPLIADLFLLAILAIGRQEVSDGTVGANGISPLDIMTFFLTLAYIAISVDASGLIRYLAFKVVQKGGKVGHRLFLLLYVFFFGLGSFIGNDPIILSGTAFLAYMTRVASNIVHPRAWIHSQFAVANIASAILVSSNPTNLVLAGAFSIKFIDYTANMIVPVVITAIVLFPFLLFIVFADESLIPQEIKIHELPEEVRGRKPVNPNIPHARGTDAGKEMENDEKGKLMSLEEVMNPFLDKGGAGFGALVMATTLITLLAVNASGKEILVFYVTLPAAFVMLCWDLAFGWFNRHETREIARKGRYEVETARAEEEVRVEEAEAQSRRDLLETPDADVPSPDAESQPSPIAINDARPPVEDIERHGSSNSEALASEESNENTPRSGSPKSEPNSGNDNEKGAAKTENGDSKVYKVARFDPDEYAKTELGETDEEKRAREVNRRASLRFEPPKTNLVNILKDRYQWSKETFPTVMAVMSHLPFPLVPFALAMFVLVEALVTKGWVEVFAYGWDHWATKTGVVGAVGGMGFISVILCNFSGTNIGTTILLSRVIQAWAVIHIDSGIPISDRMFWGTVYGMALGVNYGAFSAAFNASLAGLLWRDILARKHIHVRRLEFARVNLPIIAIAMAVGSAVLIGEVYIYRKETPFPLASLKLGS